MKNRGASSWVGTREARYVALRPRVRNRLNAEPVARRLRLSRVAEEQCIDFVRRFGLRHRRRQRRHLARLEEPVCPVHGGSRRRYTETWCRQRRARTAEHVGDRVPYRRRDAGWVENAALELLVVAPHLPPSIRLELARRDDRVHDVVHSQCLRNSGAQHRRVIQRAHIRERLGARRSARGALKKGLDQRRELVGAVAGLERVLSTSSGSPRAWRRARSSSKVSSSTSTPTATTARRQRPARTAPLADRTHQQLAHQLRQLRRNTAAASSTTPAARPHDHLHHHHQTRQTRQPLPTIAAAPIDTRLSTASARRPRMR